MDRVRARIVNAAAQDGFSLIELLAVLVIIGILLAIGILSMLGYRNRAADAVAKADVREAIPSVMAHHADSGTYVGMTLAGLRASYDGGLSDTLSLASLTASSYCIQSTVSGRTWRQNGPAAQIEPAGC